MTKGAKATKGTKATTAKAPKGTTATAAKEPKATATEPTAATRSKAEKGKKWKVPSLSKFSLVVLL